jgi:hypothetical protein
MKKITNSRQTLSQQETQLIEQLRQHPELMARVQSILEIARNAAGPLKTADEVEELLMQEMRQLGRAPLHHWAVQAEARVSEELKNQDATVRSRKKKADVVECLRKGGGVGAHLAQCHAEPPAPFASTLGVTPRGRSRRLDRVLTDFGCEHSFARAVESVQEHDGLEIGASTVQPGPGKGKRPREWKEMRLAAAQAKDSTTTIYAATFGSVAETGLRWGRCARQAGWGWNSRIHAVGDGADWIRHQCREVFQQQGNFLCDFYHVSEGLGAAAPSCRPSQPDAWRRTQQKRLRGGAARKVIKALEPHLEPEGTTDLEAPVRNGYRYLNNRLDCLDYPGALALGLPIGSGMIESGHRHVLQARLKKAGTAWWPEQADQIAHLRVLRANHQWASLWN